MPRRLPFLLLVAAACAGGAPATTPVPLQLPSTVSILGPAGEAVSVEALVGRLRQSSLVLLGELHDNRVHHEVRAQLLAVAGTRPAVVFEQFAASGGPVPPPPDGPLSVEWLDARGFDRMGWRWPLHQPVVEAAFAHGSAVWGSGVSRDSLRAVVRGGAAAAPAPWRRLMEASPLSPTEQAAIDEDLITGHCGQLPEAMRPGMRAAQVVRDASMTDALLAAGQGESAWLIAGNGHVRKDVAVPRILRAVAPERSVLVVGLLEWGADGALPAAEERARYDLVIVTPGVARGDPCAAFRR